MSCDDKDTPNDIAQEIKKSGYLINDGGDGKANVGTDDLDTSVKNCLGKYLSTLTQGKSDTKTTNKFYVDGDNENIDLSNTDGTPVGPTVNTNETSYTNESSQPWLSQYSDSEYASEGKKNLGNFLSKGGLNKEGFSTGKEAAAPWDGHELLKQVALGDEGKFSAITDQNASTPTGAVQKYTSQVLAGFNRFDVDEGQSFSENRFTFAGAGPGKGVATLQKELGVYDKNAAVLSDNVLQKVGRSLSLISSLEISSRGGDPDSAAVRNKALLPGAAQLQNPFSAEGPITAEDLRAYKVLSDLLLEVEGNQIAAGEARRQNVNINTDFSNSQRSEGNMNNNVDIFSGLLPAGMIALHIVLALVLFVAVEALALIFSLLAKPSRLAKDNTGANKLGVFVEQVEEGGTLGGFLGGLGKIATFMGVKPFTFDFLETVTQGLLVYFGLEPPFNASDLKEFAIDAPGYYATMSRMTVRSVQSISRAFDQIAGGSVIDVVNSITGIVQAIRESKIIKLINYYAQLGDKKLALNATGFESEVGTSDGFAKISGIDKLSANFSPLVAGDAFRAEVFDKVRKNRLSNRRKLAWSNSTANSMLLLPNSVINASRNLNLETSRAGSYNKFGQVKQTEFVKISPQERRDLEAWLDAEYVPFYFHDVRTNEIISFHAFLSSLSETYAANYEVTNGFGRVDPVRIYTNTDRSLNLTFTAVATSENDFDVMWAKINKLVTMVYPQWSQGRAVTLQTQDTKNRQQLIQPFSQVMTSSPMIRLRIGDVIRSNYSRFNLARLFGFGAGSKSKKDAPISKAIQRQVNGNWEAGDIALLRANSDPVSSAFNTGYAAVEGTPAISIGFGDGATATKLPLRLTSPILVQVNKAEGGKIYISPLADVGQPEAPGLGALSISLNDSPGKYIAYTDDLIVIDDAGISPSISDRLSLGPENLKRLEKDLLKKINQGTGTNAVLSPDVNPVVRSFEESGGKGLAGFITSLEFDWVGDGNPWETERYGARAPKMCDITISFSPVHDIAPGIDANGFNRAPLYNVGEAMNGIAGDGDDEVRAGKDRFNSLKISETKNRNEDQG